MKVFTVLGTLMILIGACYGQQANDEAAIRQADRDWGYALQAKDLDKTVSFYAPDASVLPFNAPIATGSAQIRSVWQHLFAAPGFALSFAPSKVSVSRARDIAYELGTFQLRMNHPQNHSSSTNGKYVVVWVNRDGAWKVAADIFNTDK